MPFEFQKPDYKPPKPEELSGTSVGEETSNSFVGEGKGSFFERLERKSFEERRDEFESFFDMLERAIANFDFGMVPKERVEEEMRRIVSLADDLKRETDALEDEPKQEVLKRSGDLAYFLNATEDMGGRLLEILRETEGLRFDGAEEDVAMAEEEMRPYRELYRELKDKYEARIYDIEQHLERIRALKAQALP